MSSQKRFSPKLLVKLSLILGLILSLTLSNANEALAARSGGRIGGGSFRTPTRSLPGGGYNSPRGGGYGGGGIGFPFLIPFFGFGGGGLFAMLIFFGLISFIIRAFQNAGFSGGSTGYTSNLASVAQVQVGLLASARDLQKELDQLALTADTSTPQGRAIVCQEASLALLRHPEYWMYATADFSEASLDVAEAAFNRLSLSERSKFSEETLSNFDNRLINSSSSTDSSNLVKSEQTEGEYIVVTIIVGVTGKLNLPQINNPQDLRQALQTIGGIGSDQLLAIEVLWSPQAKGDTLSSDDILSYYPDLRLL